MQTQDKFLKRHLLNIVIPMTALALSACGTMSQPADRAEFEYPQSNSFSGNFLAGKAAQIENRTDYAARYLLRAHEIDPENDDLRRRAFLALIAEGRIADAEPVARVLVDENPEDLFAIMTVMDAEIRDQDYQAALDAGVKYSGCTVHYVVPEVDSGPIIAQAVVPVLPGDDAGTLAQRILKQEHRIYPQVIRWIAEGRVSVDEAGIVTVADANAPDFAQINPVPEPN